MSNFNNNELIIEEDDKCLLWIPAFEYECQMCYNEFRVFIDHVEENYNCFRCPECGQIYVLKES